MSAPLEGQDIKPAMNREVSPSTQSTRPSSSHSAPQRSLPKSHSRSPSRSPSPRVGRDRSRSMSRSRSVSRGRSRSRMSLSRSRSPHSRSHSRSRSSSRSRSRSRSLTRSMSNSRHRYQSRGRSPYSPPARSLKRRLSHSPGPRYAQQRSRSSKRRPPSTRFGSGGSYLRRTTPPRSRSPIDDTAAYRYRFRLPDSELIAVLIGPHGERAKEVKFHANLVQLTFFESTEFDAPIGELVGSRLAIIDALRGITYMLEKAREGFSPRLSDDCGDIRQWMHYGEEYLEDLNTSKREYFQQVKRDPPQGSNLHSTPAESARSEENYGEHPPRDRPSFSIEVPQQAVRHLIGAGGAMMRSIGTKCRTRVYLETFGVTPVLKIWGSMKEIESVMRMVDPIIVGAVPSWRVGAERERLGPGCEVEKERGERRPVASEKGWKGTGSNSQPVGVVVESEPVGARKRKADYDRTRWKPFQNNHRRYREKDEPAGTIARGSKEGDVPARDHSSPSSQLDVVEGDSSASSLSSNDLTTAPSSATSIGSSSPTLGSPSKLVAVLEEEGCSVAGSSKLANEALPRALFAVKPSSESDHDMDSDASVIEKPIRRRDKGKGKEVLRGPFSGATIMAKVTLSDAQIAKAVTKSSPDAQAKLLNLLLGLTGGKSPSVPVKVTRARSESIRPRVADSPSVHSRQDTSSSAFSTSSLFSNISASTVASMEPMPTVPAVPFSPAASVSLDHCSPAPSVADVGALNLGNEGMWSCSTSETDIDILANNLLTVLAANSSIPEAPTPPSMDLSAFDSSRSQSIIDWQLDPQIIAATLAAAPFMSANVGSSECQFSNQNFGFETCGWTSVLDPRPSKVGYSPAVQALMMRRRVPLSSNF